MIQTQRLHTGRLCIGVNQEVCDDLFIWFGGSLNTSFQDPLVCCPLSPSITRLLLAPSTNIQVFNSFLCSVKALGKYSFVKKLSSPFSHTVFLYNVGGDSGEEGRCSSQPRVVSSRQNLFQGQQLTALPAK